MIYQNLCSKLTRKTTFLLIFSLFICLNTFAQSGTSSITGTVTDGQGNVVAGATVALISEQNSRRTIVTNDNGVYTFVSVQPGSYKIEVEAKGFKKSSLSAFQALVDKTTSINVTLEIGQVTETVNVDTSGIENIVNTQDASLGNNFVSKQIEQLPLNGRNVAALLSLQANVTPDGSVAGGRRDQANITLDGVDVNDQQTGLDLSGTVAFTPVLRVNPDSVDEFRVTTSNPDASKGRSSGAQVSLITKGGTNEFHGALYEYHRNTITSANSFFNNKSGLARPKLIRNLFGGRLGGPIVKDRLFFFYNYEGLREAKDQPVNVPFQPLASLAGGNVKFIDNLGNQWTLNTAQINSLTLGGAPVVDVNPLVPALFANAISRNAANDLTQGDGLNTGGFRFNAPLPDKQNTHTARFDWVVTGDQKHLISVRGNYQNDISGGAPAFPDTPPTNLWSHPLGLALTHTWLVNNNMTNRFSYGLTRLAFSNQGDSSDPAITFRNVYSPSGFIRTSSRVNPTQNFTDDFTWIKGNHSLQFGTNIRLVRNQQSSLGKAFDSSITNFSAYQASGNIVWQAVQEYLRNTTGDPTRTVAPAWRTNVATALTALFGRFSGYSVNFNFGLDGKPLPAGEPVVREFATEEYDFYGQDVWKLKNNLTLTLGLRYGLSRPVYETQGYQAVPSIPLEQYLQRRIDASARGENYTETLQVILGGSKNNGPGFYEMDTNNFQPRIAVAWSPNFKSGWLNKVFGNENDSVIRGGFAITNDYFGQQLAVSFDTNNTLGFSTTYNTSVNLFNITNNPAPLYTGPNMDIRSFPTVVIPNGLTFPQQQPTVTNPNLGKIERSLDTNLVSPINYSWNVSIGRSLPAKMWLDVSYVGRAARNLLAARDVMALNNIKDPVSGQTFYEAATILEKQRQAGVPVAQIQNVPFFENMYAAGSLDSIFFGSGFSNTQAVYAIVPSAGDWTFTQATLDRFSGKKLYFQNQYSALTAFGTIGKSDYHGMSVSVRQRLKGLTWDLNYTWSKSMDNASGLQNGNLFGSAFIHNALRPEDSRAVSNFDLTHVVNVNSVWDLPIGKGKQFARNLNGVLDAILGGWQLSSILRYDSGPPFGNYLDGSGWQTNWQVRAAMVRLNGLTTSPSKTSGDGSPNLFSDPDAAYNSFRTPYPGESGDRNQLRYPGLISMDAGLAKSFNMPWNENHKVTFRWDVFNVTNTVSFTGQTSGLIGYTDGTQTKPANWGNFTGERSTPRVMQFALRFDF